MPTSALIARLGQQLDQTLKPLLEGHRECALLDFPNHSNVGDSAIWLGEERCLHLSGLDVAYRCGIDSYSEERLAAAVGSGPIFLSGGGNLGDLWPAHQHFRERVIQGFPDNQIIQLPQSICFGDRRALSRARTIFNAHPSLTLLLRDSASLDIARNEFRASSVLCPDMTFVLGGLARPVASEAEILWLARSDIERRYEPLPDVGPNVRRQDWLAEPMGPVGRLDHLLRRSIPRFSWGTGLLEGVASSNVYQPYFRHLAGERLARGLTLLARGRVVITDRLHGYILSLLMGIPHVVLDNCYGKVRAFHTAWTETSPITHFATSPEEALQRARALAG